MSWIAFTLLAALMQAVRTAGQKQMTGTLSTLQATWSRYGFGLPLAITYLLSLWLIERPSALNLTAVFWGYLILASVAQLVATGLLVKLLSLGNFAVGTTYAKTEALMAAILAALFFGTQFTGWTWFAIVLGFLGIALVSLQKTAIIRKRLIQPRPLLFGLGAGLCFGMTSVSIRAGSQLMSTSTLFAAAFMLTLSLAIQGGLCTLLLQWRQPNGWQALWQQQRLGWFIGITGVLGSIGWFTAFSLQEAAIVKTLGQIEFLFTVVITYGLFKERIRRTEWLGMLLVLISVVLLFQGK